MKKPIALILALAFVLSAASCTVVSRVEQTSTVQKVTLPASDPNPDPNQGGQSTPAEIYMLINGEKVLPEYALEIDGKKVSYEEFRYQYLLLKNEVLSGLSLEEAAAYWTEENEKKLLDNVIETLRTEYAYLDFAEKNNIALTEAEKAQILTSLESAKKAYGEETLLKQLQSMYIADYNFYIELIQRENLLQGRIPDYFYGENGTRVWDDAKILEEYHKNYLRAKHILISFVSGETAENCPETLKKANEIYAQLQNGADFDQLIQTYSDDSGKTAYPDGYTFPDGVMVQEFYDAAKALELNSYSEPVMSKHGYHIILRLPLSEENWDKLKEELLFGSNTSYFYGFYRKDFEAYTKEINEAYHPVITINPEIEGHINHDSIF